MTDILIISSIVVLVILAHYWLYLWVRFKIDEGVIINFIQKSADNADSTLIAAQTNLTTERVITVCTKSSRIIIKNHREDKVWTLL